MIGCTQCGMSVEDLSRHGGRCWCSPGTHRGEPRTTTGSQGASEAKRPREAGSEPQGERTQVVDHTRARADASAAGAET